MNRNIRKKLGKYRGKFKGFDYLYKHTAKGKSPSVHQNDSNSVAIMLHSGSTTGDPKTICLNNDSFNFIASHAYEFTSSDHKHLRNTFMLSVLPSFHGFGLAMTMHCPLVTKMGIVLVPKFSPKEVDNNLKKTKFQLMCGVPTMYQKLFSYEPFVKNKYFKDMFLCFSGGDGFKAQDIEDINKLFIEHGAKARLFEGYGLTEAIAVSAANQFDHNKAGSIGYPIAGAEFKIVDENNQELPRNSIGEIIIKTGSVMLGYYKDEAATKEALKDGWLYTGDLGYIDDEGFLFFKSRKKRVVKVSGVAVFPSEVEKLIESMPQVKSVCCVEIPDAKLQSAIKAFVVADYFDEEGMRREILDTCRKYLIRWAVPKDIEFRKELPLTQLGKVDFKVLQQEVNNKNN